MKRNLRDSWFSSAYWATDLAVDQEMSSNVHRQMQQVVKLELTSPTGRLVGDLGLSGGGMKQKNVDPQYGSVEVECMTNYGPWENLGSQARETPRVQGAQVVADFQILGLCGEKILHLI